MSISVDDVEALRSILSSLPRHQPKQVSKQEAIASLVIELAAAQRRGYSADDLARLMSEKGIDINGPTLGTACAGSARNGARDKAKTPQASGGTIAGSSAATSTDKKMVSSASGDTPTPPHPPAARDLGTAKIESRPASSPSDARTPQK